MLSAGDELYGENVQNGFSFEIHQDLANPNQTFARFFLDDEPFAVIYPVLDADDAVAVELERYIPSDVLDPDAVRLHEQAFRQNLMSLIDKAGEQLDFNTDYALHIVKPPKNAPEITKVLADQFWETWGDMRERPDPIWDDINDMFTNHQVVPTHFGKKCDGVPVTRKPL